MSEVRITVFAIPKAFEGHSAVIQENALRSWTRLPDTEVILFGRDPGVAEAAARHRVRHVTDIGYSALGTPLLGSAFTHARELSDAPTLCYVNADIILFEDFLEAVDRVPFPESLIVARRRNVDIDEPVDLHSDAARARFLRKVADEAAIENPFGSDVFAFPQHRDWGFPPFAVGRPAWDNWLMWTALRAKVPLVDVTAAAIVVHQNHDYGHVPAARGGAWEGPEADANRALLGSLDETASLLDATHVLVNGKLQRPRGPEYTRARILMWGKRSAFARNVLKIGRPVFRAAKAVRRRRRSGR